jgi:hypothetical protein
MKQRQPLPWDAKLVAWLFLLWGSRAAIEMAVGLAIGKVAVDFGLFLLPIGYGLLRYSESARKCAVVMSAFTLVIVPISALTTLHYANQPWVSFLSLEFQFTSMRVWAAFALACFLLTLWQYRVLTRASVRALFRNPYRAPKTVAPTFERS